MLWWAVGIAIYGVGTFTRFGHAEVLYATELIGMVLIFTGYRYSIRDRLAHHAAQAVTAPDMAS